MAQIHTQPGQVVKLSPLGPLLAGSATKAILKGKQLEVIRLVLHAGKSLREHQAPGEITVLCIEGSVEFSTPDQNMILNKDDFLHLDAKVPHALKAITDTSLLLTICLPSESIAEEAT